jgi:hypothetical protein
VLVERLDTVHARRRIEVFVLAPKLSVASFFGASGEAPPSSSPIA